jgi:hypothetical protein
MPAFFEWEMRLVWLRFQASPALSLRLMAVLFLCRPADENCSCSQPERERERGGGETGRRERIYTDLFFPIGGPGVQVQREAGRSCGFGESNSNPNHYRERKRCPSRA